MKKVLAILVLLLAFFLSPKSASAAEPIRITGFDYPRNEYPFYNPFVFEDSNYISPIVEELNNPDNFGGDNAVVPCGVNILPFVNTLTPGYLVSGNRRNADVFIAGTIWPELSSSEAQELKSFLDHGGIVFVSGGLPWMPNADYHSFFEVLGVNDRFSNEYDETDFMGTSHQPIDTPITNGPFGKVGELSHSPFRVFNHFSLLPVAKGFLEGGIVTMGITLDEPVGLSENYMLFEKDFGDGYLSVAGTPIYLDDNKPENVKYFLNLVGHACGVPSGGQGPFLDLPWDYETKGMSFSTAALSISSYFDHEYPLLSINNLSEPTGASPTVVNFRGVKDLFPYTRHDGYDWGRAAQTKEGTPVLAAAAGVASFRNSCASCGNAILIDHGNGFQTRYYHLKPDGLILNQPGQTIEVSQGQQIGLVGHTGNVRPEGEAGSHIHFMVVQDKNNDGNFDDNIPDGLVDPFGWQSHEPDPWPNYSFFYNGQERTGNVSNYLWTKAIANLSEEFDSNGAFFNLEHYSVNFPQNTVSGTHKVNLKATGGIHIPYETVGYPLDITIIDGTGNPVTYFPTPFTITIDFSGFDLSRLLKDTLSIYSSSDGITWTKEDTTFDWENNTASADVNHASFFVLAGERVDTTAPTTTAILSGEEGQENWYRSNVEISLVAEDNAGGLGVEYTAYKLDGEDWQEYVGPIIVTEEGEHKVEYYSVDNDENAEEAKTVVFNIDKQIPEISIFFNPDSLKVEGVGIDENKTTSSFQKMGFLKAKYSTTDSAGNELTLEGSYFDFLTNIAFSVSGIKYNSEEFPQEKNWYSAVYKKDRRTKKLSSINQSWTGKEVFVNIFYQAKTDKSYIYIKENGRVTTNTSQDGLVVLYIETDNGNLKYRYE